MEFRDEHSSRYHAVKAAVLQWLADNEEKVNNLRPVALDLKVIQRQVEELEPLLVDYEAFGPRIDEVNDLGNVFDSMTRGDQTASPIRRTTSKSLSMLSMHEQVSPYQCATCNNNNSKCTGKKSILPSLRPLYYFM